MTDGVATRLRRLLVGLLFVLMTLAAALPARADDASLGRIGECVRPIDNNDITMVAEEITITADRERSVVTCRFTFHNDGPATSVLMGFPDQNQPDDREGFADDVSIHDFTATADGQPLAVTMRQAVEDKYTVPGARLVSDADWWTFTVPFAAGQDLAVVNSFWVKNVQWSNGDVRVGYTLVSGRTWKGPIGHIEITLVPRGWSVADLTRAFPGGYTVDTAGTMGWEWDSVEPGGDISVIFNSRAAESSQNDTGDPAAWERSVAADTDEPVTVWHLARAYLSEYGVPEPGHPASEAVLGLQRHASAHAERELAEPVASGGRDEAWFGVARMVSAIAGAPQPTGAGNPPVVSRLDWSCADRSCGYDLELGDPDGDLVGWTIAAWYSGSNGGRCDLFLPYSSSPNESAGDGRSMYAMNSEMLLPDGVNSFSYRVTATDFSGLKADTGEVTMYVRRDGTLSPEPPRIAWRTPLLSGAVALSVVAVIVVILAHRRPAIPR